VPRGGSQLKPNPGKLSYPDRELDWHLVDDELHSHFNARDLALGGADLAAAVMRHDLVDEYRVYVHPVVIGRGRPMFQPLDDKVNLRLVETRTFGNGVVLLRYQRP
jgi:dihydrofolate reductase